MESLASVRLAALVGVGPTGTQVCVAVVEAPAHRPGLASVELLHDLREAAGVGLAAALVTRELPVDIRHNSKIDRTRLARWAADVLAGDGSAAL